MVGQAKQPNNEVGEVSSLVKPKKERNVGKGKEVLVESPSKEKKITDKGNWKKIAREKNKAQVTGVGAQSPIVEKKKKKVNCEETEVTEVRP